MNVTAGATFEPTFDATTGLVGTLALGIYDTSLTVAVSPLSTAGIIEPDAGVYAAVRTAPDTVGTYTLVWSLDGTLTPGQITSVELNATAVVSTLYITREELKAAVSVTGTYADDDIDRACAAASRAIDEAVRSGGCHFYQATETRYYTPDDFNSWSSSYGPWREHRLEIDDCVSITSLTVDTSGDGTYATSWTEGTDFFLEPANSNTDGKPFEEILIRVRGGVFFPRVQRAIKIVGVFGWPVVPPEANQYALILATQLVLRSRQAPFGILMAGMETGATARISRFDPDFDRLLGSYVRPKVWV